MRRTENFLILKGARLLSLVALVYSALTVFVFFNFIPRFNSALIGPREDNMQDFWNTWYAASRVRSFHDLLYTNLIRFPEGTTLYYHSFAYPKILLASFFGAFFGTRLTSLVGLENLLSLISFPVSAVGAFYLARHFTRDVIGALIGGAIFALNPSHIAHVAHHMHVSSIEFIPFFAWTFILAEERRRWIFVLLSTLCFVLSALSSWYYLFYCFYFMVFYYLFLAVKRKLWLQAWPLLLILYNLVGLLVLLSPLLAPMIVQAVSGANVYAEGGDLYGADVVGYVAFPPSHLLFSISRGIYSQLSGNPWEATVYLGLVNIALLAWLVLRRKQLDRNLIAFVLSGMALFGVLASGEHLHLLGHPFIVRLFGRYRIPLPDRLLDLLPFFKNVRTPSRSILLAYMFLSIGVAYAISVIWREHSGTWLGKTVVAGLALVMALDWYPRPLPSTPLVCSQASVLLSQDSDRRAAVLDLPRGRINDRGYMEGNAYMTYQACHLHPIVDGTISRMVNITLADRLVTDDLEQQRWQLVANNVKYIVIHRPDGDLFRWSPEDGEMTQYMKAYPVFYSGEDATILRVY